MKLLTVPAVLACALLLAPSQTLAQVVQEEVEPARSVVELPASSASAEDWHQGLGPEIPSLGARKRSPWLLPGIGAAVGAGGLTVAAFVRCAQIGGGCSPIIIPYVVIVGGAMGGAYGWILEKTIQQFERPRRTP